MSEPFATIVVRGQDDTLELLRALEDLAPVRGGLRAGGDYLLGKLRVYPEAKRLTRASVYGTTFKTLKQQRYFFAALASGEIEVPYKRGMSPGSESFGDAWMLDVDAAQLRATIGNDTTYGPLLMQREKQSQYAAAVGWETAEDIAAREEDDVTAFVEDGIQQAIAAHAGAQRAGVG